MMHYIFPSVQESTVTFGIMRRIYRNVRGIISEYRSKH